MEDLSAEQALACLRQVAKFMMPKASDTMSVRAAKVGFQLSIIATFTFAASVVVLSPGLELEAA